MSGKGTTLRDLLALRFIDGKEVVSHFPKMSDRDMDAACELLTDSLEMDMSRIRNLLGDDAVKLLLGFFLHLEGGDMVMMKTVCKVVIDPLADKTEKMMTMVKSLEILK